MGNKNVVASRRTFLAVLSASTASAYLPLPALAQQLNLELDEEDYLALFNIKRETLQAYSYLCISPDDNIERAESQLSELQERADSIIKIEARNYDLLLQSEPWTATNLPKGAIYWVRQFSAQDNSNETETTQDTQVFSDCANAVIVLLSNIIGIPDDEVQKFKNFLIETNVHEHLDGIGHSVANDDLNTAKTYLELLLSMIISIEAVQVLYQASMSHTGKAIASWLTKRSVPVLGQVLLLLEILVALYRSRRQIAACVR